MHRPALSTQRPAGAPIPLVDRATGVLRQLRERVRQSTRNEVQARTKLLVEQLERLAHLNALELARKDAPDPVTLRMEIDALERGLEGAPESKVELLACRITCMALSRRSTRGGRRPGRGAPAGASLEHLRLDARTLFEWAKADLWSSVARGAIAEANRTASSLELEAPAVLTSLRSTLARPAVLRVIGDELAQVAEDLAMSELRRLLTRGRARTARGSPAEEQIRRARNEALLQGLGLRTCAR